MQTLKPMKSWEDVIINVNAIINKLKTHKCFYRYEGVWAGILIPEIREIQEFSIETRCDGNVVVCFSEKVLSMGYKYCSTSGFWEEDLSYKKINAWFHKFKWEKL